MSQSQSNFVSVLEAAYDGFGWRIVAHRNASYRVCFHPFSKSIAGETHYAKWRIVQLRAMGSGRNRNPDLMRQLCRDAMKLERGKGADDASGNVQRDLDKRSVHVEVVRGPVQSI